MSQLFFYKNEEGAVVIPHNTSFEILRYFYRTLERCSLSKFVYFRNGVLHHSHSTVLLSAIVLRVSEKEIVRSDGRFGKCFTFRPTHFIFVLIRIDLRHFQPLMGSRSFKRKCRIQVLKVSEWGPLQVVQKFSVYTLVQNISCTCSLFVISSFTTRKIHTIHF